MMLPSKKVLSILIISASLVTGTIIAFGNDKTEQAINAASSLVAGDKINIPENTNWQSELGNISVSASELASQVSTTSPDTVTDRISVGLISNYLALKQKGELDQTSSQGIVDQTLDYLDKNSSNLIAITEKDLNVVPDNGLVSIQEYGNNLGNILKSNRPKNLKKEVDIINQAITSRNEIKLTELDSVIEIYKKIHNQLLDMDVPKEFTKSHLYLVNGTLGMYEALEQVKTILRDPVAGLQSIQLYQQGVILYTQSIRSTNAFIQQNKIIYEQGSGGYYLFYGI